MNLVRIAAAPVLLSALPSLAFAEDYGWVLMIPVVIGGIAPGVVLGLAGAFARKYGYLITVSVLISFIVGLFCWWQSRSFPNFPNCSQCWDGLGVLLFYGFFCHLITFRIVRRLRFPRAKGALGVP